ncbi:MAG: L-seryl-tRNA(Sec) selenium transferase, partial [Dehalococcoidia bacterium]|nr:L-seryl-tRNA(Sec) selenium transferase [Dehalococcoidia bacterium]
MDKSLRNLPSVDKILSDKRIQCLEEVYSHDFVLQGVRQYLEEVRHHIAKDVPLPSFDQMVESICTLVNSLAEPNLRPVINATGVILHTNLGRAPLSREAIIAMEECSRGYTNLEIDLDSGKRGSRQ